MTQQWIVGVIVLAAAAYALWYWLPSGLRRRLGRIHPALVRNAPAARATAAVGVMTRLRQSPAVFNPFTGSPVQRAGITRIERSRGQPVSCASLVARCFTFGKLPTR